MKKLYLLSALILLAASCDLLDGPSSGKIVSEINLKFAEDERFSTKVVSGASPLDTNSFLIKIVSPSGATVYEGTYGGAPQKIPATAGTYYIRVVSEEMNAPQWENPQWGDEQYVKVESGKPTLVNLLCRQMNCGVKLDIDPRFPSVYSDALLVLKAAEGRLMYGVREKRTAFFRPGSISLVMSRGAKDEVVLTRTVGAGEILCLKLVVPANNTGGSENSAPEGLRIQVDTTRTYLHETHSIGTDDNGKGDEPGNALTIAQAKASVGETDVWVGGYIVGGDLSSKSVNFEGPFSSATALALGPKSSTSDRDACIAVQLPIGDVRDAINLADNPQMHKRYVYLKGDIVASYYGLVGLKNITEYVVK